MNPWNIIGWMMASVLALIGFVFLGLLYGLTGFILFNPGIVILGIVLTALFFRRRSRPGRYVNRPMGSGIYDRESR